MITERKHKPGGKDHNQKDHGRKRAPGPGDKVTASGARGPVSVTLGPLEGKRYHDFDDPDVVAYPDDIESVPVSEFKQPEPQLIKGDPQAREKLGALAKQYNVAPDGAASIFERWVSMGMAEEMGLKPETAVEARKLHEAASNRLSDVEDRLADDEYLYHVTSPEAAESIQDEGMLFGYRSNFPGYGGHSAGRVFFTERSGVNFWREKLDDQYTAASDDPEAAVVLRVPKAELSGTLRTDVEGTRDAPGTAYYVEQEDGIEMEPERKHLAGKKGDHDQSSHGRRGGVSAKDGDTLADRVVKDGGYTYQPITGLSPTKGFAIALFPENEVIIDSIEDVTAERLLDYMLDHESEFESDQRVHFGAWYNRKTDDNPNGDGKIYLDMSMVVDDREEAIKLAKQNGQLGIFDLASFETIETMTPAERAEWEKNNDRKSYAHSRHPRYNPGQQGQGSDRAVRGASWPKVDGQGTGQVGQAYRAKAQRKALGLNTFDGNIPSSMQTKAVEAAIGAVSTVIGAANEELESIENPRFVELVQGVVEQLEELILELEGLRSASGAKGALRQAKSFLPDRTAAWHPGIPAARRGATNLPLWLAESTRVIDRAIEPLRKHLVGKKGDHDQSSHGRKKAGVKKKKKGKDDLVPDDIEIEAFPSIDDYPNTREGHEQFLADSGSRRDAKRMRDEGWDDALVAQIARNQERSNEKMRREYLLAPDGVLSGKLEYRKRDLADESENERLARIYNTSVEQQRRQTELQIKAIEEVIEKRKLYGISGKPWKQTKFTPAKSFDELESWWRERGVTAAFEVPDDVETDEMSDKWRWSLDDANKISARIVELQNEYPETQMHRLGFMYSLDQRKWEQGYRANLQKEYDEKIKETEQTGKRWSRAAAQKRVKDKMISPPPKNYDSAKDSFFYPGYDLLTMATASRDRTDGSQAMRINHRSRGFNAYSDEEARQRRDRKLKRLTDESLPEDRRVMDSVTGTHLDTVTHEYGHLVDFTHELSSHPKMVKLHNESKGRVALGLSDYATTNIQEFIAEGFAESYFDDARPLGKKVRATIDEIVAEKK